MGVADIERQLVAILAHQKVVSISIRWDHYRVLQSRDENWCCEDRHWFSQENLSALCMFVEHH